MRPDDTAGSITWSQTPGEPKEIFRVTAAGRIFVEGVEGSPAMAEDALRRHLSGTELDDALAHLRKLTSSH